MTPEIIQKLRALGMNEYEARVYSTLAGLQKATAREYPRDEWSSPGPDLRDLKRPGQAGFIGVEEGSPTSYYVLDIDQVF